MTSAERHEARYQRRKAARQAKREEKVRQALDFDSVFSFTHLYASARKCLRGVRWKASVQKYRCKCGINVARRLRALRGGVLALRKPPEFPIRERGHLRIIHSIHIEDRVPQKCMCKYSLKPVLHRTLIYDNYASQEGKGTELARDRLKCMLERHIRRYGFKGGVIVFDFKGFFDSIQHGLIRFVLDKNYTDKRIIGANMRIVKQIGKKIGVILGSENSQDFAVVTPNMLDHMMKDVLRVEGYGRYMDDGWIIHPDMTYLKSVFNQLKAFAARLGFTINEKKSKIISFGKPFTMMKRKYTFTETGKIIIRPSRESVIRERRKLKKLYKRFLEGTLPMEAGRNSVNAWMASLRGCKCWKIKRSIMRLYDSLYIENWLRGEEDRKPCTTKSFPAVRLSMPATA